MILQTGPATPGISRCGGACFLLHDIIFSIPVVLFVPVQRGNFAHLVLAQLEIKDGDILPDMLGIAGAWNDSHASLQIPAEDHLHQGLAMGSSDVPSAGSVI